MGALKKLFYRFVNPFRLVYWFVFRPRAYGTKVLIEHEGKFLLIRNTYGSRRWTLPGGYKEKDETPEVGAKREAREEVGIQLENIFKLGEYYTDWEYKKNTIYCFWGKVSEPKFTIDHYEVGEAGWFGLDDLPKERAKLVDWVVDLYKKYQKEN